MGESEEKKEAGNGVAGVVDGGLGTNVVFGRCDPVGEVQIEGSSVRGRVDQRVQVEEEASVVHSRGRGDGCRVGDEL